MSAAESLDPFDSLWDAIAIHLRKERQRRKLTMDQVAQIIGADRQRVGNYEANRLQITKEHSELLDREWGTMFAVRRRYAAMFGRDQDWVKQLWDFEKGALVIKAFIDHFIPVPLQTEAYARCVFEKIRIVRDVDTAVRKRMQRTQALLEQETSIWALIDEDTLRMPGLPDEVKREQLRRLLDLSQEISIRVVRHADRLHVGTDGSFELITTSSGRDVAYAWAQVGGRLIHEASEVRNLALRYDRIGAKALTEEGSRELFLEGLELPQ
ncbi:helix-turn-helix transcriptional regulator [Spirillospora sp. NPDC047279]|uniref:helix-turn-helix domain-containing protein n=1 Tax=Spirillospora sp. NPDC047279 TaxID=3155478 RepID=UPI00340BB9F9